MKPTRPTRSRPGSPLATVDRGILDPATQAARDLAARLTRRPATATALLPLSAPAPRLRQTGPRRLAPAARLVAPPARRPAPPAPPPADPPPPPPPPGDRPQPERPRPPGAEAPPRAVAGRSPTVGRRRSPATWCCQSDEQQRVATDPRVPAMIAPPPADPLPPRPPAPLRPSPGNPIPSPRPVAPRHPPVSSIPVPRRPRSVGRRRLVRRAPRPRGGPRSPSPGVPSRSVCGRRVRRSWRRPWRRRSPPARPCPVSPPPAPPLAGTGRRRGLPSRPGGRRSPRRPIAWSWPGPGNRDGCCSPPSPPSSS